MSKMHIVTISNLGSLQDLPKGQHTNISIGLITSTGQSFINIDPHGMDIKNMTIADLEKLAIEKFLSGLNEESH
jgi:hypothetical protein